MIILSEYHPKMPTHAGTSYLKKMEDTARLQGFKIVSMDRKERLKSLEFELERIGKQSSIQIAFWLGFVPSYEDYQAVSKLLTTYHIHLINSPQEFANSEYFDRFYTKIAPLTFKSYIVHTEQEALQKANLLEYPIFIKGAIQSLKKWGWEYCIAYQHQDLKRIIKRLYEHPDFSLNTIILREYVPLKSDWIDEYGAPKAHEYRFMIYNSTIIDYSFYWNGVNPYIISEKSLSHIKSLALQAANAVKSPFVSVDIALAENGKWYVVELGDGQFSDIRQISPLKFWSFFKSF